MTASSEIRRKYEHTCRSDAPTGILIESLSSSTQTDTAVQELVIATVADNSHESVPRMLYESTDHRIASEHYLAVSGANTVTWEAFVSKGQ